MSNPQKDAGEISDTELDVVVGGNAGRNPNLGHTSDQGHQQSSHGGTPSPQHNISNLSGYDMANVHVHMNGSAPATAAARAFTEGNPPQLQHQATLSHEGANQIVQQGHQDHD